jgi:HPt (histidine-containing phosphotransfer) domain-containing protein
VSTLDEIVVTNLPALDPLVLAELSEIQQNGRPGFIQRVIKLYLQAAADLVEELQSASANNEPAVLYRASHTLKPCSSSVGASSLAALCEALETLARSGCVPDPAARVEAIVDEYKRVEAALAGMLGGEITGLSL